MRYDPQKHQRRSIRLRGYDYSQAGAYFVTICTQNRECLFGEIVDEEMRLNDTGSVIERWWCELNKKFSTVETGEFVVRPNHFHGIVVIAVGADLRVGPVPRVGAAGTGVPTVQPGANPTHQGAHIGAPLPTIIQWFKTMTTNEYMRGVKTLGWMPFRGRLWQRNYYEHVIRAGEELDCIRRYIEDNPGMWEMDRENPAAQKTKGKESWQV